MKTEKMMSTEEYSQDLETTHPIEEMITKNSTDNPSNKQNKQISGYKGQDKVPLDILRLPEFLQEYVRIAGEHTDAIPGALITAFLPVAAANIGNRVRVPRNGKKQSCMIWAVLVGPSTLSRKTTCQRMASHTCHKLNERLKQMSGQDRSKKRLIINETTKAKLISLLAENPNRLLEYREFACFLKGADQRYNAGMKETITALYDGDSNNYDTMDRTEYVDNPALSISGASTSGWVYRAFENPAEQQSGFLQRFIYCVIGDREGGFDTNSDKGGHQEDEIHELHEYDTIFEVFRSIPKSYDLFLGDDVQAIYEEEHNKILNAILKKEDEILLAYATRIYNNVALSPVILITLFKVHKALENAICLDQCDEFFAGLRVSEESMREALYLCEYYLQNAKPMITIIEEGGAWHNERRVAEHLAKKAKFKDSHSNIMNALHLKAKDMRDCIQNLEEREIITVITEAPPNGRGKPARIYELIDRQMLKL